MRERARALVAEQGLQVRGELAAASCDQRPHSAKDGLEALEPRLELLSELKPGLERFETVL